TDTPGTVPSTHLQRARESIPPGAEKETERCTALSEAHILERSQLVRRSNEERGAGDPTPGAIPREHVTNELSSDPRERIGQEPDGAPHEEVAGGEDERGTESSRALQLRVESHGRRDRGEHHCGHHHDPHAEEPS